MAQPPLVLGVDSSTQSTKVEARRLDSGERVGIGRAPHPPTTPPRSEQDPRAWWRALVEATAQLGELRRDVVAISVAGQQHGLVVSGEDLEPLRPAKLWNDTESAAQAARLVEDLGAQRWARECGSVPVAAFTVTKLAWLVEHEPGILGRVAAVGLPHDWITARLCGRHVTDRGDASGTGWFDAGDPAGTPPGRVCGDLLAAALVGAPAGAGDVDRWESMLPQVLGPREAAGSLRGTAADELGLPRAVLVGPGTGDNMAAALGLGLREGDVAFSLGTSGTVYAVAGERTADATGAVAGFADATGRYLPLVCTLNATKVTDTVARWLGVGLDELSDMALAADPGNGAVPVLVPYFDGERTPDLPDAAGSITGLRNSTTTEELALAAHDGVLGGLLEGLSALRSAGVAADARVFLVGGGARSAAYRVRLAELTGRTVRVPTEEESVAAGAAVQAAVVAGGSDAQDPFAAICERWGLGAGEDTTAR